MRKFLTFLSYTIIILIIGRNLPALPRFYMFSTPKEEQNKFVETLKQHTNKLLVSSRGNYGIYYADLNNPYAFGINEKETFTAASINKVPIVTVLYYLDNKGKIGLDEKITIQREDLQAYGTGSLQNQEPGSVYSLRTLAKYALQQSDNTAAYILAKRIGYPVIQKTIEQWGLKQTDINNNKTSAYDTYLMFKKIYKSEIATPAKTQELLGFMADTDIEDRLPALLPSSTKIFHKTGDTVGGIHDVGIIQKGGTGFFLAVLTSDIGDNEAATKQTIAQIAKNILNDYDKPE
jgi:beta-lactamase class A